VDVVVTQEKLAGDEIALGILWVFHSGMTKYITGRTGAIVNITSQRCL